MTNSCKKGKRGQREAAAYLTSLGLPARNGQQRRGDLGGDPDVIIESLPHLHVEVKYGYPPKEMNLGTVGLTDACEQARKDCGSNDWVVLWRNYNSKIWKLTFPVLIHQFYGYTQIRAWEGRTSIMTVAGDNGIGNMIASFPDVCRKRIAEGPQDDCPAEGCDGKLYKFSREHHWCQECGHLERLAGCPETQDTGSD